MNNMTAEPTTSGHIDPELTPVIHGLLGMRKPRAILMVLCDHPDGLSVRDIAGYLSNMGLHISSSAVINNLSPIERVEGLVHTHNIGHSKIKRLEPDMIPILKRRIAELPPLAGLAEKRGHYEKKQFLDEPKREEAADASPEVKKQNGQPIKASVEKFLGMLSDPITLKIITRLYAQDKGATQMDLMDHLSKSQMRTAEVTTKIQALKKCGVITNPPQTKYTTRHYKHLQLADEFREAFKTYATEQNKPELLVGLKRNSYGEMVRPNSAEKTESGNLPAPPPAVIRQSRSTQQEFPHIKTEDHTLLYVSQSESAANEAQLMLGENNFRMECHPNIPAVHTASVVIIDGRNKSKAEVCDLINAAKKDDDFPVFLIGDVGLIGDLTTVGYDSPRRELMAWGANRFFSPEHIKFIGNNALAAIAKNVDPGQFRDLPWQYRG